MKHLQEFLVSIGLDLNILISGLVGGLISLTYEEKLSPVRAVVQMVAGSLCAAYITPVIVTNLSQSTSNAVAFVIGVLGMKLIGGLFTVSVRFYKDPIATAKEIVRLKKMETKDKDGNT